jgi:transcription-repair coupling factor (superfamily II helicase)
MTQACALRPGSHKAPTVMEPGDYAVRGGSLIFIHRVKVVRSGHLVMCWTVYFDPATQRTTETLPKSNWPRYLEVILMRPRSLLRQNYRLNLALYSMIHSMKPPRSRKHAGIEHWLNFRDNLER